MLIENGKWKRIILLYSVLFCLLLFFEIIPKLSSVISRFYSLVIQKASSESQVDEQLRNKILISENTKLKKELSGLLSNSKESTNLSSLIQLIDELAKKSNVEIESINPGEITLKNKLLIQKIELTIFSEYEDYYKFVYFLENTQKIILVKEFTMKPYEDGDNYLQIEAKLEVCLNI